MTRRNEQQALPRAFPAGGGAGCLHCAFAVFPSRESLNARGRGQGSELASREPRLALGVDADPPAGSGRGPAGPTRPIRCTVIAWSRPSNGTHRQYQGPSPPWAARQMQTRTRGPAAAAPPFSSQQACYPGGA
jgi:hypothetical protein